MSGKIVILSAMSGIAAIMLRLGATFHGCSGVPIPYHSDSSSKIKLNSRDTLLIRDYCLIMVDKISMMNWKILRLLDRFLQEMMNCNTFMGSK